MCAYPALQSSVQSAKLLYFKQNYVQTWVADHGDGKAGRKGYRTTNLKWWDRKLGRNKKSSVKTMPEGRKKTIIKGNMDDQPWHI